jgi:Holliday junction resolvase RusA-like endonuclease
MGWTIEQFREFCTSAGINPDTGLANGSISMEEIHRAKEKKRLAQVQSAITTNELKKKRAKARATAVIRSVESERPTKATLAAEETAEDASNVRPDKRVRVCIVVKRVRPCDPDNNIGGLKTLIDCLRESGLIQEDNNEAIQLEASQKRVSTKAQEGTEVTLVYP